MTNPFSTQNLVPTWAKVSEIMKGDLPGHAFHGNQYEVVASDGASEVTAAIHLGKTGDVNIPDVVLHALTAYGNPEHLLGENGQPYKTSWKSQDVTTKPLTKDEVRQHIQALVKWRENGHDSKAACTKAIGNYARYWAYERENQDAGGDLTKKGPFAGMSIEERKATVKNPDAYARAVADHEAKLAAYEAEVLPT